MYQIIIYKQDNDVPALIIPTQRALEQFSITEIAVKDVPNGKPFKIIDIQDLAYFTDIPQEAWIVDEADLTDGIGTKL